MTQINTLSDTLTFYDLQRISLEILKDISENLGYDPAQYQKIALAQLVWDNVGRDREKRNELFSEYEMVLFANKASLKWYKSASLIGLKDRIVAIEGDNIYEGVIDISETSISTTPKLFSIADTSDILGTGCFFARFLYQDGVYNVPTAEGNQTFKKIRSLTAFVDEENGIIEIRGKGSLPKKVVQILIRYFEDNPETHEHAVLGNHGDDTRNLADSLGGNLIESSGAPTFTLNELTDDQVDAIVSILEAIDEGLGGQELAPNYESIIDSAREVLFSNQDVMPFLALILAGLDKVSLTSLYQSLVSSPLYNSLSPYLTNNGGYVKFESNFGGIQRENTILVARKMNSIYLTCNSDELAIKKIRDCVCNLV